LVTGGGRGIGRAITEAFAAEGARVVIASRKQEALDAAAAEVNAQYPDAVVGRACHLGHTAQITALVEWIRDNVGQVDVLVNNSATNPYFGPMLGVQESAWDKTFEVNLKGPWELTRALAGNWLEENRRAAVVNVASIAGLGAAPLQGVYGMTKAAMISMTQTLAYEWGTTGIRVNAIAPGLVETRLAAAIVQSDDLATQFNERTALKRHAQPVEMAGVVVYLASDESSFVTGQVYRVDGGYNLF